jgi:hypothetical protein
VLLAGTALAVAGSLGLRVRCLIHPWVDRYEYSNFCYSDLQALWHARGLAEGGIPYVDVFLEYPTLTGIGVWLTAWPVSSDVGFVLGNAVVLGVCALLATWGLYRATGCMPRTLLWVASPALLVYALQNWELYAVAPLAVGLWLWRSGRWTAAGAAFGLGAAAKLFPLAALPLGVAWLWQRGRRREAGWFAGTMVGVLAAANVPFLVANADGWLETWRFHAGRFPDFGTVWYWLWEAAGQPDWDAYRSLVDRAGLVTMAVAGIGTLAWQWRRRLPMEAGMALLVAIFLVVTKVHSPQYALWILPFFVVIPAAWRLGVAYLAVDVVLFVSGYLWIATPGFPGGSGWRAVFTAAVVVRAVLLVWAAALFARTTETEQVPVATARAVAGSGDVARG